MTIWILPILILSSPIIQSTIADDSSLRESQPAHIASREQRLIGVNQVPETNDDEMLLMESAGAGKPAREEEDDEEKKSLSQQVAEGKYGLIQNELFSKATQAAGVISYKGNPEVPKDTIKNLGGLNSDDIWLAEDHLLVLKGGIFSGTKNNLNWPPIDNYKAPRRQVKIPKNPAVPPPFPVQLQDDGPIQILSANGTSKILPEDSVNTIYPTEGYSPGTGPFFPPPSNQGPAIYSPSFRIPGNFSKGNGPLPFPIQPLPPGGGVRRLPPFLASLPPNAVYLPPPVPQNQTEAFEEDDPSIYYPPPYTFYYSSNASRIPAGPLVPGIILPPPPDFFGQLEDQPSKNNTSFKYYPRNTTKAHRIPQVYTTQIPPTTTTTLSQPPEVISTGKPIYVPDPSVGPEKIPIIIPELPDNSIKDGSGNPTSPSPPVVYTTTRLKQVKPTLKKIKIYTKPTPGTYYEDSFIYNPIYSKKPHHQLRPIEISTTAVPLKAYFSTTGGIESPEIESNSLTNDPNQYYQRRPNLATRHSPKFPTNKIPSAEYYFYEEEPSKTSSEEYYKGPVYDRNKYYDSAIKTQLINSQILRLQNDIQSYLTSPKKTVTTSKPVYQYSFQAAGYIPNHGGTNNNDDQFRPIVGYNPTPIRRPTPRPPPPVYPDYGQATPKPVDYSDYDNIDPSSTPRHSQRPPFVTTENPVNHAYYTKHEERLLDDITKQYFNVFGQKIAGPRGKYVHFPSTTPLPPTPTKPPSIVVQFGDNSQTPLDGSKEIYSLHDDTRVNNISAALGSTPDPHSEYISTERYIHHDPHISLVDDIRINTITPRPTANPEEVEYVTPINTGPRKLPQHTTVIPLHSDIDVNYKNPRPTVSPDDVEIITPVVVNPPRRPLPPPAHPNLQYPTGFIRAPELYEPNNAQLITNSYIQQHPIRIRNRYRINNRLPTITAQLVPQREGQAGQFISFPLPGNGAHFYFLTPQVIRKQGQNGVQQQQQQHELADDGRYLYEEANQRLRRSRFRNRDDQIYTQRER